MDEEKKVLEILRSDPLGKNSEIIGEIIPDKRNLVILNTSVGGKRILDMPSGAAASEDLLTDNYA